MDFDALTAEQVDALKGHEREAWYAWRSGDAAKADAILAAYPADVETPEDESPVESPEDAPADVETPEDDRAEVETRTRRTRRS